MPQFLDYAGAGARLSPEKGLALDPRRWAWMPKVDGVYARVTTDQRGRIVRVLARSGSKLADARDLLGVLAGPPDAVMHGELEAHTEAGNRAAAIRGWRNLHLFDLTRARGESLERASFAVRHGELQRSHALIECDGAARVAPMELDDRTFLWAMPSDGSEPVKRTARALAAPGTMRPGGAPRDLRRLPIVPLARGAGAGEQLWRSAVELGGGEGLVAVRLDAPLGARGGKRKVKATDTYECRVVSVGMRAARLEYGGQVFAVSAKGKQLVAGDLVELTCDGWYERGATPKFPRIVRVRTDLRRAA